MKKKLLFLMALFVSSAMAWGYDVTMSTDASNWAISSTSASPGATVTLTYNGTKMVKSVSVRSKYTNTYTINSTSEINSKVGSFNSNPGSRLVFNVNYTGNLTFTAAEGEVDFNGHAITGIIFVQNNVSGKTVVLKNGTITKEIDGKSGISDFYAGTLVMDNMTLTGTLYNDGHYTVLYSGTYATVNATNNNSTPGTVLVYTAGSTITSRTGTSSLYSNVTTTIPARVTEKTNNKEWSFVMPHYNTVVEVEYYNEDIALSVDGDAAYSPTTIVNGDFSSEPWMDYVYNSTTYTKNSSGKPNTGTVVAPIPNGVGGGWNTSDNTIAYGVTTLFEWTNVLSTYNKTMSSSANSGHGYFIEMNAEHAAVFSQDLATYGNDVIRWTLQHAVRTTNGAPSPQAMEVEIGAPNRDGEDNIIATSGTGGEVNAQIQESTKAVYLASGCSGYNGYGGVSGNLEYLSLTTSQATQWYTVTGVYTVPDGQSVTRFAFISRNASSPGVGNLLDNLTFSTLIGNLSAVENSNGSVSLRGYWGETDTSKKLMVKIGDETTAIDMTSMVKENFIITIPKSAIGNAAQLEVYHQDYEAAKRTISVSAYAYDVTANLANGAYWATFYSNAGNYQAPDGTQVFAVNLNTTTAEITMTEISDRIAKSGEGVVLKQETTSSDAATTITMTLTATAPAGDFSANSLLGTMTDIENPDYGHIYVLNKGTQGVGFYKLKSGKTIDANKAYLTYSGALAREFFLFDEATGIEMPTVEDVNADAVVYDLQGRRVQNPTKGLYIVNGKKVFINK